MMNRAETSLLAQIAGTPDVDLPWLDEKRAAASDRFSRLGLPTPRLEDWRYTSLSALGSLQIERALEAKHDAAEKIAAWQKPEVNGLRLVFVNGRMVPDLCVLGTSIDGVHVGSLAAALKCMPEVVEPHLGNIARFDDNALAALNTSSIQDGALIVLSSGMRLEHPIELHFFNAPGPFVEGKAAMSQPRVLILAGPSTAATVIETYAGPSTAQGATAVTNALSEVALGDRAEIDHYRLQDEGEGTFHFGLLGVTQGAGSRFSTHSISLGATLARNEVRVALEGEGAQVTLRGLYLASGAQHVDNVSLVEHASPRCITRQTYKGILGGHARGVFSGRIRVKPGAQNTDAYQLNSNLLLSENATVDSKPQLEIFADDVKCGHGGVVGRLDEDSLFYLQSRGIERKAAERLLTYAFAKELVGLVGPAALRDRVEQLVTERLSGSSGLLEMV